MNIQVYEKRTRVFTFTLSEDEAKYLVEQHAENGSPHHTINHSFCHDVSCVSCAIVKQTRLALKSA